MGSNNTLTRFRVLKIDRMEPRELIVVDDKREYTQDEIKDLVNMIDMGNRTRAGQRSNVGGVARVLGLRLGHAWTAHRLLFLLVRRTLRLRPGHLPAGAVVPS